MNVTIHPSLRSLLTTIVDGRITVGIEDAVEKTLNPAFYTYIPNMNVAADTDIRFREGSYRIYRAGNNVKAMPDQLIAPDNYISQAIIVENYNRALNTGLFVQSDALYRYVASKVLHYAMGWIGVSNNQEIRYCPYNEYTYEDYEEIIKNVISRIDEAALLILAAALTYYTTNHHMGGSKCSGIIARTAKQLNLELFDRQGRQNEQVYKQIFVTVHPPDKRTILYLLLPPNPHNSMAVPDAFPSPRIFAIDSFSSLRTKVYPAGTNRIILTDQILRHAMLSSAFEFAPHKDDLDGFLAEFKRVIDLGFSVHPGAKYLTTGTLINPVRIDQNSAAIDGLFTDMAIYAVFCLAGSSMAAAPAVRERAEEAVITYKDWADICKAIQKGIEAGLIAHVVKALYTVAKLHGAVDEQMKVIFETNKPDAEKTAEAQTLLHAWRTRNFTRYANAMGGADALPAHLRRYVVEQGDLNPH